MSEQTIMERLKGETWPQHQQAEGQTLEKELVSGKLPKESFVEYLGQRYLIHQALESVLQSAAEKDARIESLLAGGRRLHEPRIAADLNFFGQDPLAVQPLPATKDLVADIQKTGAENPIALLGFFYVFEGSTNGARYIARAIRGAYRLSGTDGTQFLDPYGEEQRPLWDDFKNVMNAHSFTTEEKDAMIAAAGRTFTHIMHVDGQIYAAKKA